MEPIKAVAVAILIYLVSPRNSFSYLLVLMQVLMLILDQYFGRHVEVILTSFSLACISTFAEILLENMPPRVVVVGRVVTYSFILVIMALLPKRTPPRRVN